MKKIFALIIVCSFLLSGISTLAVEPSPMDNPTTRQTKQLSLQVSPFEISPYDSSSVEISLKDCATYVTKPGLPLLPKEVRTVELPFGARDITVSVTPLSIEENQLEKPIRLASARYVKGTESTAFTSKIAEKDKQSSTPTTEFYPEAWYAVRIGCGLNAAMNHVTHVVIDLFPFRYRSADQTLSILQDTEITITYQEPDIAPFANAGSYDMVIIAPPRFQRPLKRFVDHKNTHGVRTVLETTRDIYKSYLGFDKPEQIKYFIKDCIEQWGIRYVLLVGGLNSLIWAKPKDDVNQGSQDWYVPVRYNNLFDDPEHPLPEHTIYDPGVITDLYYADIYEQNGNFSSWDPNRDGVYAAWGRPGVENDTGIDMFPDVAVGRLACRNIREVNIMVDKIISYENVPADPYWFNKMVVVSGDGFLDQEDLDIQWDVSEIPNGVYTIYAQATNIEGVEGPIDEIPLTVQKSQASSVTFNHDDHLKVDSYPAPPIIEITSPSPGDVLGNTDVFYCPSEGEAYGNEFTGWANVSYKDRVMNIRGKTYDPKPYGVYTDVHIWIENSQGEKVFCACRCDNEMYYEGEWITGERMLRGRGGALYYMPENFERDILWASNGKFTGQQDVIEKLSEGAGFAFMSGHGSPRTWGDHYPGVPGNRRYGSLTGLVTVRTSGRPILPMEKITNYGRPFILVVGGCHNSQFNVSLVNSVLDLWLPLYMWTYGGLAPECFSWWMTRLKDRGAIATIGNTGLGYGTLGGDCTIGGLDGGISLEFFRHYGELGYHILGETYLQTQTYYAQTFDLTEDDHAKSLQQWTLLGDPSLMIGGYS